MRKHKIPVRFTGQHFTIDKVLIVDAIKIAELKENDTVLDIGAGKGFLTIHLAQQCKSVLAIENDKFLLGLLRRRFSQNSHVKIIDADFRNYTIPNLCFKVVANIPYRITSEILQSLMFKNVGYFLGGALVMQLEAAQKLFSERIFTPYPLFYHTFFDLELVYEISPDSFMPPPKVKSALLRIKKKRSPNINVEMKEKYLEFLFFILHKPDLPVRTVLKKIFRKSQVREISEKYGIGLHCQVVNLSAKQWSDCFVEMLAKVPERFHPNP